jgi:hypothetical protein
MYAKVTGTTFIRDMNSGALINKDISGLEDYKRKRKMAASQREEINTIRSELDSIKSDVSEIKQLMQQLLVKGSNGN